MAGMEKVCECPKENCEYHAGDMYLFKRRHLQINPECRSQFKGLTAYGAIVSSENTSDEYLEIWGNVFSYRGTKRPFGSSSLHNKEIFKDDGKLYHESFFYTMKDKLGNYEYYYDPIKLDSRIDVWVYVKEHDTFYLNWLESKKDIRAFKKNMRKLFGYDIPLEIDLRMKQVLHPETLAKALIGIQQFEKEGFYEN